MEIANKRIRLTKVGSIRFEEGHPNGINNGYTTAAFCYEDVVIGEYFHLGSFRSTRVLSIDGDTFSTKNSTYKVEILD